MTMTVINFIVCIGMAYAMGLLTVIIFDAIHDRHEQRDEIERLKERLMDQKILTECAKADLHVAVKENQLLRKFYVKEDENEAD